MWYWKARQVNLSSAQGPACQETAEDFDCNPELRQAGVQGRSASWQEVETEALGLEVQLLCLQATPVLPHLVASSQLLVEPAKVQDQGLSSWPHQRLLLGSQDKSQFVQDTLQLETVDGFTFIVVQQQEALGAQ